MGEVLQVSPLFIHHPTAWPTNSVEFRRCSDHSGEFNFDEDVGDCVLGLTLEGTWFRPLTLSRVLLQ